MTPLARRLGSDGLLLVVALLWGSAFVPQRIAAPHIEPFFFNGLRFALGGLLLLPWMRPLRRPSKSFFRWAGAAGMLLVGAATCQQAGMEHTTAANAGFLTSLYVVLVPIVLLIGWRQKTRLITWVGAVVAAAGACLLSVNGKFQLHDGDALEIAGAVMWAMHVVVVGKAMQNMDVLLFSVGQYLIAGVLDLVIHFTLAAGYSSPAFMGLEQYWWTVVYVGVASVAIGYTLQAVGQKYAPAADAAIMLSMESVFAALFGYLFLKGETLNAQQLWGCALILTAIIVVQLSTPSAHEGIREGENG